RIIEGNISSELGECFHLTDAVLRVPHVHPNVKALNWHRHRSTCTSRTNSAMLLVKDGRVGRIAAVFERFILRPEDVELCYSPISNLGRFNDVTIQRFTPPK